MEENCIFCQTPCWLMPWNFFWMAVCHFTLLFRTGMMVGFSKSSGFYKPLLKGFTHVKRFYNVILHVKCKMFSNFLIATEATSWSPSRLQSAVCRLQNWPPFPINDLMRLNQLWTQHHYGCCWGGITNTVCFNVIKETFQMLHFVRWSRIYGHFGCYRVIIIIVIVIVIVVIIVIILLSSLVSSHSLGLGNLEHKHEILHTWLRAQDTESNITMAFILANLQLGHTNSPYSNQDQSQDSSSFITQTKQLGWAWLMDGWLLLAQ